MESKDKVAAQEKSGAFLLNWRRPVKNNPQFGDSFSAKKGKRSVKEKKSSLTVVSRQEGNSSWEG